MAETIIAPAPPGVQSTFDKPLGPQSNKGEHASKFRKAFAELTKEDVTPKEEPKVVEAPKEEPKKAEPPKEQPKETPPAAPPSDKKPESPLEAVLAKPTAKEPEKVEEPDVLKEFDEKTANWQRAREVMKTQSDKLKTLQEKVKSLETAPKAEPSVIETLTKERDTAIQRLKDQDERIKGLNYIYSDEYQQLVSARETDVAKLSDRVSAYGGDAKSIVAALSLPEGKVRTERIDEALAEVGDKNRGRIDRLIERIEEHDEKIADAQKDSPKRWEQLQAQREAQVAEQSQAAIKQLETEYRKIADELPNEVVTMREVADDVPGGTDWNKDIRAADEIALRVLKPNGADFKESVTIAKQGAHYPFLMKRYLALHSDYTELKKSYNEAVGSGPDFKGGTKPSVASDKKPGLKYREALAIAKSQGLGEV